MFKKISRKSVLIVLVVALVVGLFLTWAIPTFAEGSCGPAPAIYETISEEYGTTQDGDMIYIARAIVGREQGIEVDGRTAIELPRCWSRDPSLTTIANLGVTLASGEQVTLIVGVVGRNRLPFEETPLPQ